MDLGFLSDYIVTMIVATCLGIGYVIKNLITTDKINKYIPLIMAILGVIINIWINGTFTPVILLGGLISGLASTGMYEAFRNLIEKRD